jgi:hypothetical protein
MGPFSWFTTRDSLDLDKALRGDRLDIAKFAIKDPSQAILEAATELRVKELEFASLDGEAIYLATEKPGKPRIVSVKANLQEAFNSERILDAVKRAVSPRAVVEHRLIKDYEIYYVDRQRRLPLPVLYIRLNDASQSAYYLDPQTGKVVKSYSVRSRWNRWLYHGLHSLDFPWLYARRPAWDILILVLMLGGTALSGTALSIAWKVVQRKLRGVGFRGMKPPAPPNLSTDPTKM